MSEPRSLLVEDISVQVRTRVHEGRFRCLSAFLFELVQSTEAEAAGVMVCDVDSGSVRVVREIDQVDPYEPRRPRTTGFGFARWKESLLRLIVGQRDENTGVEQSGQSDYRYVLTPKDKNGRSEVRWLFAVRVWSPSIWKQAHAEQHWLYLVAPELIAPVEPRHPEMLAHAISLMATSWFRWKAQLLDEQEVLKQRAKAGLAVSENDVFSRLVRPLSPKALHQMLRVFTQSAVKRYGAKEIEEFADQCINCSFGRATPCCDVGGTKNFPCPQAQSLKEKLRPIALLEIWRTGFWKPGANPTSFNSAFEGAVQGLRFAAKQLKNVIGENLEWPDLPASLAHGSQHTLLQGFVAIAIERELPHLTAKTFNHKPNLMFGYASALSELALLFLTRGPWEPSTIKTLAYVIGEFGHRELDIPRRINLTRHLEQTLRGESALYTLKKRYRDHFFHTVEVCLMGYALLTSHPDPKRPKLRFVDHLTRQCGYQPPRPPAAKPLSPAAAAQDMLGQWWLAAILHDTAYGIDILSGTKELLEFFDQTKGPAHPSAMKDFLGAVGKALTGLGEFQRSQLKAWAPELEKDGSLDKGDHGVIAALHMRSLLGELGADVAEHYTPAERAIAFHNTHFPPVNAKRDPLAALLILCDQLQDWGRSSLGYDRSPELVLSRLVEASGAPEEEQFGPVKRYSFNIVPSQKGQVWRDAFKLSVEMEYSSRVLDRLETVPFVWGGATYNFQRVNFSGWNIELKVRFLTPNPAHCDKRKTAKLHEFTAAVERQSSKEPRAQALMPWLMQASQGRLGNAVYHEAAAAPGIFTPEAGISVSTADYHAQFEGLTLDLVKLGRACAEHKPLMALNAGVLAKVLLG
ncbi:MAG TPA: hypothetical protein VNT99_04905 [Methylomirabilota bacterium]|nr:hypothetical protein [Methylomirabilota bacterium]